MGMMDDAKKFAKKNNLKDKGENFAKKEWKERRGDDNKNQGQKEQPAQRSDEYTDQA